MTGKSFTSTRIIALTDLFFPPVMQTGMAIVYQAGGTEASSLIPIPQCRTNTLLLKAVYDNDSANICADILRNNIIRITWNERKGDYKMTENETPLLDELEKGWHAPTKDTTYRVRDSLASGTVGAFF